MSILIIGAHPDDETLGCGGTIARYAAENKAVHILILGEGIRSRSLADTPEDATKIDRLRENARQAARILGARSIHFESFPDNRFDTISLLDIVKKIEAHVKRLRPHTIFTHHGGDLNIDHTVTFRATLTATRPVGNPSVKSVYAYETLSSTEWAFDRTSDRFSPSLFINIENYLDIKTRALAAYKSETCAFPHPRSDEALRALAAMRGSTAGLACAEAFSVIRTIKP